MGDDTSLPTPKEIESRLRKLQGGEGSAGGSSELGTGASPQTAGLAVAMRIGVELVSALMVGVGIGYLLDSYFGTRPWLLLVFFFIGAAAGILNVWRVASGQNPSLILGSGVAAGEGKTPKESSPSSGGGQGQDK